MHEPGFWRRRPGTAAALLTPLAAGYGAVAAWRLRQPGKRAGVPVICIGNLTHGGAGKTPTALAVGELLRTADSQPFFLTRGYGGRLRGPVLVDLARHGAAEVGDEPLLLARIAPTIVAHDRVAGAAAAHSAGATAIVMDDGFQNPSLAKDLSILVVDAGRGIRNGRVFPAGPLRAPLDAQIERAQALMVVGDGAAAVAPIAAARARKIPVFFGRLEPNRRDLAAIVLQPVLAFSGIGVPEKFFATLDNAGIEVRARRAFPDHHAYSRADATSLLADAKAGGLVPVTTEKDMVRLAGRPDTAALAAAVRTLAVTLAVEDAAGFTDLVRRAAE
ncbi:MAG: tetraacyldisaccharide 4'-kinase [Rhizobiales bacterium]|nr:tetraacyldisaccharide 4'-kinase [Hyphomicrobiales bacterium]